MEKNASDIASLITSRICHDLISPVGAINNGLELLELSGGIPMHSQEMALVRESVANASGRIQFFRIAFGQAPQTGTIGPQEASSIIDQNFSDGRFNVKWTPMEDQARSEVKLVFLLVLCLRNAAPRGGTLKISKSSGHWRLELDASKFQYDRRLWDHIRGDALAADISSAEVHFELARSYALDQGAVLSAQLGEHRAQVMVQI